MLYAPCRMTFTSGSVQALRFAPTNPHNPEDTVPTMPEQDLQSPRHHLLIAGTGRAGTSFLVRWLAAAGLRTLRSAHDTPMWDDAATAGLEDLPIVTDWRAAPYVMKSPWLVEVIDEVLASPQIVLDGVIIPVRDLTEVAASRIVQEMQTAYRKQPWMSGLSRGFEHWGTTAGGVVYSLDPVDQARLLAVSFHRLLHRLVQADIPVVLLDFPRLAQDADYLFGKLRRFVPATVAQAREAHAALADPEKIRVGRELAATQDTAARDPGSGAHDQLETAALRREVRRLSDELAEATRTAAAQQAAVADLHGALETQAVELAGLTPATRVDHADNQAAQAQVATLIATVERRRAEAERAAAVQQEAVIGLRGALDAQSAELAGLVARLEARDAERQAAQADVAALTAAAEQSREAAERAAADHQAVVTGLRNALDARAAELAALMTTLEVHDADLGAAQARVAMLTAAAEQQRATAECVAAAQHQEVTALRDALNTRATELAELASILETRDADLGAAQARVAVLTTAVEQQRADALRAANEWQAEAQRIAIEHQATVDGLRGILDTQVADLARLASRAEARDIELQNARALIAETDERRAELERRALDQQAMVSGLRDAMDAKAAELAGLAATLAVRDADLQAQRGYNATLTATAEQQRDEADRAMREQQAVLTGLRDDLEARAAELAAMATMLEARETDLRIAQAQIAALAASAERLQQERDAVLADWSWRAGQPLRMVGRAGRAVVTVLGAGRRPLT